MKNRLYVLFLVYLFIGGYFSPLLAQPSMPKLDQYIESARQAWNVPGLSVAIVKDGKVVLSKGYGVKEAGKSDKVDGGTLFAIASNTKAFVATAVGQLVSQGKLSWDDKVVDQLPYFTLYDDYATRHATV